MRLLDTLLDRANRVLPRQLRDRVVVFGSAPMVLAGLKPDVSDLDFFTDEATFAALARAGFAEEDASHGVPRVLLAEQVEVYKTWVGVTFDEVFSSSKPLPAAHGLRVAALEHVLAYKRALGREKDLVDEPALLRALGQPKIDPR